MLDKVRERKIINKQRLFGYITIFFFHQLEFPLSIIMSCYLPSMPTEVREACDLMYLIWYL